MARRTTTKPEDVALVISESVEVLKNGNIRIAIGEDKTIQEKEFLSIAEAIDHHGEKIKGSRLLIQGHIVNIASNLDAMKKTKDSLVVLVQTIFDIANQLDYSGEPPRFPLVKEDIESYLPQVPEDSEQSTIGLRKELYRLRAFLKRLQKLLDIRNKDHFHVQLICEELKKARVKLAETNDEAKLRTLIDAIVSERSSILNGIKNIQTNPYKKFFTSKNFLELRALSRPTKQQMIKAIDGCIRFLENALESLKKEKKK